MTETLWSKRRLAVHGVRKLSKRLEGLAPLVPGDYKKDATRTVKTLNRLVEVYDELDDERERLEAQVQELTNKLSHKRPPPKKAAKKKPATTKATNESQEKPPDESA